MRIEFTYTLADIREARVPERFAAHPERYARRWIRVVLIWVFTLGILSFDFLLARLTANPKLPVSYRSYDARTELAPAVIFAVLILAVYVVAIRKNWRASRNREVLNSPELDKISRLFNFGVGMLVGLAIWLAIFGAWNLTWRLTPTQIVLVTVAPWAVLFVFMQILGFLQRRAQTVGVWRSTAGLQRPKTLTMEQDGLRIDDARYVFEFRWPYFERVRETKNLLILIGEGGSQHLIPKRAFADPADLERCRSLLQNAVPNTRYLIKPGGFAVLPSPALPLPAIAAEAVPHAPHEPSGSS